MILGQAPSYELVPKPPPPSQVGAQPKSVGASPRVYMPAAPPIMAPPLPPVGGALEEDSEFNSFTALKPDSSCFANDNYFLIQQTWPNGQPRPAPTQKAPAGPNSARAYSEGRSHLLGRDVSPNPIMRYSYIGSLPVCYEGVQTEERLQAVTGPPRRVTQPDSTERLLYELQGIKGRLDAEALEDACPPHVVHAHIVSPRRGPRGLARRAHFVSPRGHALSARS